MCQFSVQAVKNQSTIRITLPRSRRTAALSRLFIQNGPKTRHFTFFISLPIIDRFSIFLLAHSADNLQ